MNITSKQWFQIISGIVSGLITGAALLQTLFGQDLTLKIVAGLGVFGIILNSVGAAFSTQSDLVKDVNAMPGVAKIEVNAQANPALAKLAISTDPTSSKVVPTSGSEDVVNATAKGS